MRRHLTARRLTGFTARESSSSEASSPSPRSQAPKSDELWLALESGSTGRQAARIHFAHSKCSRPRSMIDLFADASEFKGRAIRAERSRVDECINSGENGSCRSGRWEYSQSGAGGSHPKQYLKTRPSEVQINTRSCVFFDDFRAELQPSVCTVENSSRDKITREYRG